MSSLLDAGCKKRKGKTMHILLASDAMTGHMLPAIRVGQGLLSAGHKVSLAATKMWIETLAVTKFSKDICGMNLVQVDDGLTEDLIADAFRIKAEFKIKCPWNLVKQKDTMTEEAALIPLQELHEKSPIDYAVIDFCCPGYFKPLKELGIDYCVNLPGQASQMWMFRVEGTENWSWMMKAQRVEFVKLRQLLMYHSINRLRKYATGKPWLIHSFVDLDKAAGIPPIPAPCKYCGSLGEAPSGELAEEFASFFQRAASAKLPVICVSLGSMIRPDPVIIDAIYKGLNGGPWFVIWSLYDWGMKKLPSVDKEKWLIDKWIPQAAILAHPGCKLFFTHGGWGGLMEACASGKPVLCLPFSGDQPINAILVEKKGWGLALPNQKLSPVDGSKNPPEYTGKLTADEVRTKATRILETSSYQEVADKLKAGAVAFGGRSAAAEQVVEWANLSKQGQIPKPTKARAPLLCWPCAAGPP